MLIERLITIKETPRRVLPHMSLSTLPQGTEARVVTLAGSVSGSVRVMEMGMEPGASMAVMRNAPLVDPMQMCLRNYHLALRRVDADKITVFIES